MIYPLFANGTVVALDPGRRVIEEDAAAASGDRLGLRQMYEMPATFWKNVLG